MTFEPISDVTQGPEDPLAENNKQHDRQRDGDRCNRNESGGRSKIAAEAEFCRPDRQPAAAASRSTLGFAKDSTMPSRIAPDGARPSIELSTSASHSTLNG